jgi:predicted XRE-type DNA-binding protein
MPSRHHFEVPRSSGNVSRDLKRPFADVEQLKAILAAEIIMRMNKDDLSTRAAHAKTGIAAANFSRIRNDDLSRFNVDRLMAAINLLGARVDVAVKIRVPRAA